MLFPKILTPLRRTALALLCGAAHLPLALAQPAPAAPPAPLALSTANVPDSVILDMREAFRRGDRARLAALLPQARGHALEPWAAYWELKTRLEDASGLEAQDFLARWAGTYQEDRLRNDWLLLAGKRRDWASFAAEHPRFRMRDDAQLRCYAVAMDLSQGRPVGAAAAEQVRADWLGQRDLDDACLLAADLLHQAGRLADQDIWRKARLGMETNRPAMARAAVALLAPDVAAEVAQIQNSPGRYLASRLGAVTRKRQELASLALIKLATSDPDQAAALMDGKWASQLQPEERHWTWAVIGKQAALKLQDNATRHFAQIVSDTDLTDELLAWKARAGLRAGQWHMVRGAIEAMSAEARAQPDWTYWLARARLARASGEPERAQARQLLESVAGTRGFYEKLAQEELGRPLAVPPAPPALSAEERQWARQHPGLNRALLTIGLGLRSEGVREWNYWTNLHSPGGLNDRELLAAAELACQRQVWDRCINTSERTQAVMDYGQRFPMPHQDAVVRQARAIGLDPAYVYGLIRQESRFIMDARSGVGASGLMQIMPATARWTARKIGLDGFSPGQINELDTNILIGTSYLKLALDEFRGSLPLAAAAYNAGPGRPRNWRNGPTLEGAIWAENIPFAETRDYVKKVLSNTTDYAALLTGQPQSLKARLGTVGPATPDEPVVTKDLP